MTAIDEICKELQITKEEFKLLLELLEKDDNPLVTLKLLGLMKALKAIHHDELEAHKKKKERKAQQAAKELEEIRRLKDAFHRSIKEREERADQEIYRRQWDRMVQERNTWTRNENISDAEKILNIIRERSRFG